MKRLLTFAAAVALLIGSGAATAFILDDGATKNAAKWRSDVQKQTNKLTDCVTKETLKCEKKTLRTGLQCDASCITTGPSANTGGALNFGGTGECIDPDHPEAANGQSQDFIDAINKCVGKFDPGKKAFDYDGNDDDGDLADHAGAGCLGDCSGDDGTQLDATECGGMSSTNVNASWIIAVAGPEGTVRETLPLFDLQFQGICGASATVTCQDPKGKVEGLCTGDGLTVCKEDGDCVPAPGGTCDKSATVGLTCTTTGAGGGEISFDDCDTANGECVGNSEDALDCVNDGGKILAKMVSKVAKEAQKCEEDFKDKTGNGGPTDTSDDTTCNVTFGACAPLTGANCDAVTGNQKLMEEVNAAFADLGEIPATGGLNPRGIVPTVAGGIIGAADDAYNYEIDFDGDGLGDGSAPVRGGLAPSCGSCGDGTLDYGEQCDPGMPGFSPPSCGTCYAASNFLLDQTACTCSNL